jgi:predicted PurR-regulated permease PerM
MKKRYNIATTIGILLYILYSAVDRFFWEIPDAIAIPVMILGIILIIGGFVMARKEDSSR